MSSAAARRWCLRIAPSTTEEEESLSSSFVVSSRPQPLIRQVMFKDKLFHHEEECELRQVACRYGCGKTLLAKALMALPKQETDEEAAAARPQSKRGRGGGKGGVGGSLSARERGGTNFGPSDGPRVVEPTRLTRAPAVAAVRCGGEAHEGEPTPARWRWPTGPKGRKLLDSVGSHGGPK